MAWLTCRQIDNELVRKQLIINNAVEQTILISDRAEAIRRMDHQKLNNVRQCFTQNQKPGSGLRLAWGFGGNLSQTFIQPFNGTPRMKTDVEYQVKCVYFEALCVKVT